MVPLSSINFYSQGVKVSQIVALQVINPIHFNEFFSLPKHNVVY